MRGDVLAFVLRLAGCASMLVQVFIVLATCLSFWLLLAACFRRQVQSPMEQQ